MASHPELTDAARELVHNDISANPQKYAQSEHAQALLSYAGVHRHLLDELHRIEDMGSDEEFEQTRNRLFDDMRDELLKIVRIDAHVLDAQLLAIILADTPVDACLGDLMKLEASTADYLQQSVPGFDMEAPHYWANNVLADGVTGGGPYRERAGPYRVASHTRGHLAAVHGERSLPRRRQLCSPCP